MKRRLRARSVISAVAMVAVLGLLAASPVGASRQSGGSGGGDELVLGAEQEPDCADWIASCAGASWGVWTMMEHTMPRVFDIIPKGDGYVYKPSLLMASPPKSETVDGQQVVTYEISEDAVWNDNEPITSSDFLYTWDQIVNTEDIYDRTGYANIESVDDSDPNVAVVTFATPFSGWRSLFGGGLYGILPSHILEGQDRSAAMTDGYTFSGGPYQIEEWERGVSVTLVTNENYWGPKPKTGRVVFQFLADTAAEFAAFKDGEVLAIYPQPQPDVIAAINQGVSGAKSKFSAKTGNLEALWINNEAPPFDEREFREAVAYAINRDVLVKRLFGDLGVNKAANSLNPPLVAEFSDQKAFSKFKLNLKKVDSLMEGAGWAKGDDDIWERDGERAEFTINSTTGNQRRELTEQILQEMLQDAGFEMTIENQAAGDLFGETLPNGDFQIALYAAVETDLDPGLCSTQCSANIPSEENDFSGQNWTRTNVPDADEQLAIVDETSDAAERKAAAKKADRALARDVVSIPLDPLPTIAMWSNKIKGVKGDHAVFAVFWNLHEWELK